MENEVISEESAQRGIQHSLSIYPDCNEGQGSWKPFVIVFGLFLHGVMVGISYVGENCISELVDKVASLIYVYGVCCLCGC